MGGETDTTTGTGPGAEGDPDAGSRPGWGYAPQAVGAPTTEWGAGPELPDRGPPVDPPAEPVVLPRPRRRLRFSFLVCLAIGVLIAAIGGALVVWGEPSGASREVRVSRSPTPSGGVELAIRDISPSGGFLATSTTWETHDLDPEGLEPGDVVTVQVDPACFCNPRIDHGHPWATGLGLALTGLGVVVAIAAFAISWIMREQAAAASS